MNESANRSKNPMNTRCLLCIFALASTAVAADWPAYKRDAARSSVTTESVKLPLAQSWTWQGQPPRPAWGEPGRSLNPLDFDYAAQPVVASGTVFLASSADDTVRAFDAASGALRWQFTAGGPVRFAPQIENGRCYFAADDGVARCLDAATGAQVWARHLGVDGSQVIANGRIASRWPCRSGVLVRGGIVYVTAGMWPSEGVYIFALDAATGAERWCNDTSCYEYIEYPHVPSASFGGPAPQGALLATEDTLLVPTGRGVPAAYDLKTGRLIHYAAGSEVGHKGGTWATVSGDTVFVTAVGWQPDVPPRLGESPDHFADSLAAFHARTGKEEWPLTAAMKSAAPEWKEQRWRGQIAAGLLGRSHALFTADRVFAFGNEKGDAWEVNGTSVKLRWSKPRPRVYAEALTANALLLGEENRVVALDPATGGELWQAQTDGQVRGLAVSDGRVFASTHRGTLHVFGAGAARPATPPPDAAAPVLPATLGTALEKIANARGFAFVLGGRDASLAQALASRTQFQIVAVLADARAVQAERARLVSQTSLYGTRIHVLAADGLKLPSYAGSLVITLGDAAGIAPAEWYRVLRPAGGVLCSADGAFRPPPGVLTGEAQGALVVRGKLPGAFDWNGKAEADERVRWPLEFTWFGEPNGQLQKARHTRPRTPLAANGRLFVFGENTVTALDAYSGAELWRRRLDAATGMDAPTRADDTSFSIATGGGVARFDAGSGRLIEFFSDKGSALPVLDATKPLHIDGAMRPGASCAMDIESTADALRVLLTAKSAARQRDDAWELAFDFRPAPQRVNAPGPGTFQIIAAIADGTLRELPTFPHPMPRVEKVSDGKIALTFAWKDIEKFAGSRPSDFTLAADCKLWNAKLDLTLWARPLTDGRGKGINDAEAVIVVSKSAVKTANFTFSPYLPAPLRPLAQSPLKLEKNKLAGLPLLAQRRPNADLSDFGASAANEAKDASLTNLPRAKGFELSMRTEPFTGASNTRDYAPSYGCSGIISSATMDFLRSGCIGLYDRADDSGMRNISGIRSGCGQTLMPALGMLLYAEGTGNCLCTYNYAASFGMAPTGTRRNEDWALFDEHQMNTTALQRVAFNLGAAGDRRDADGTLWLALPRPALALKMGTAVAVPARLDVAAGLGAERINTDRRPVAGTDKPWLYGSNIRGLQRLHLDMQYYKPGGVCLSVGATAPVIDGDLRDACWDGFGGTPAGKDGVIQVRHDAQKLYIARAPAAGAKAAPFAIAIADGKMKTLIAITVAGGKPEVKRLDVPDFDRKAKSDEMPNLAFTACELPGASGASGAGGNGGTELAIPWRALESLGLDRENLRLSPNPVSFFGRKPHDITRNFSHTAFVIRPVASAPASARYTVRLHFCELDGAAPGERTFDVLLNGKPAITGLDIAREAGPMKALVKEFRGVTCAASLDIELRGKPNAPGKTAPLLSAIEVIRE